MNNPPDVTIDRQQHIGGSEIAALLGLSPWQTPLELYYSKVNPAVTPSRDKQAVARMNWGKRLEDVIAAAFTEETGQRLRRVNQPRYVKSFPVIKCHLDRKLEGRDTVWEGKTVNEHRFTPEQWGNGGTDHVPPYYITQPAAYMAATGWGTTVLSALIGGERLVNYYLERNAELETLIIERAREFWQCVQTKTPPPPRTNSDLNLLYPEPARGVLVADGTLLNLAEQVHARKERLKQEQKELEALELALKCMIAGHEELRAPQTETAIASYKWQKHSSVDLEALAAEAPALVKKHTHRNPVRVLRVKGLKKVNYDRGES